MIQIPMKIGPKGQVVIPKVLRNALKLYPKSEVVFTIENEKIVIESPKI